MYICELCGAQTAPFESCYKKALEFRSKTYPERYETDPKTKKPKMIDKGGTGHEIAREIRVCKNCV